MIFRFWKWNGMEYHVLDFSAVTFHRSSASGLRLLLGLIDMFSTCNQSKHVCQSNPTIKCQIATGVGILGNVPMLHE